MVVNAIGAGRITVIGRSLRAHWMQFFLCNHAHVVPIAIAVLLAACFSETNRTMGLLVLRHPEPSAPPVPLGGPATYLHRQKAMSRLRSSWGPL